MLSYLLCPDGPWQPQGGPLQVLISPQIFQLVNYFTFKSISALSKHSSLLEKVPFIFSFWIDHSLDIEGAEWPVLQTIPWDKVNIRVLIIETNHLGAIFEGNHFQIRKMLKENGYKVFKGTDFDEIYVKRKFWLLFNLVLNKINLLSYSILWLFNLPLKNIWL